MTTATGGPLERLCSGVNSAVEVVLALSISLMIAVTFVQVFFRYGLNSSISWSEELVRYTFIWAIFLGTSCAMRKGQHIAIAGIVPLLPAPARRALGILTQLLSGLFFLMIIYTGLILTENAIGQTSSGLRISLAFVYAAAPAGAALVILHLINGLADAWRQTQPDT